MILYTTNLPLPGIWLGAGLAVSLIVLILVAWESVRLWRKKELPGLIPALAFLPPVLLFAASYLMRPVFVTRGFLAAALGYLGLAGVIVARRWPRIPAGLVLAGFMVGAGIGLPFHYSFDEFPRSPVPARHANPAKRRSSPATASFTTISSAFSRACITPQACRNPSCQTPPAAPTIPWPWPRSRRWDLYPQPDMEHAVGDARRVLFCGFHRHLAGIPAGRPARSSPTGLAQEPLQPQRRDPISTTSGL